MNGIHEVVGSIPIGSTKYYLVQSWYILFKMLCKKGKL